MSPAFASRFRVIAVALLVMIGFAVIGYRLYILQVVRADELSGIAERARRQVVELPSRRGNIVDARGSVMATTRTLIELGVDPRMTRDEDGAKLATLARLIDTPLPELLELVSSRGRRGGTTDSAADARPVRWRKLHDGIDEKVYQQVMELGISGVYGNRRYARFYPDGSLAAHVVGFINREFTAVTGVEHFMDFYLRGQNGWMESERDGRSRELPQFRSREVRPTDGLHVELTLDVFIQHVVEEELRHIAATFNPKGATIIVSDPATGFLLAMANYPTFDLNEFNRAPVAFHRNLAITDVLEPGSTFKIVPVAAAINEGITTPDERFDCGITAIQVGGRMAPLPRDHRPFGELSVTDILARSSNVGVAHLGVRLGANRLYEYSRRFGFGERTGFPLAGEVRGTLHDVSDWDGLTITRLPMGHALNATPLQIHNALAALANRGVLMRPQVVRRVFDNNGETVFSFRPTPLRRVVSEETTRVISPMLARAVSRYGTAARADIPGFEVAGKTGTSRKIIDGRYSDRHHIASFIGYFPASDPRLVMTIIVDEPRAGGSVFGGVVAAPSFRRIGERLIPYLGIRPRDGTETFFALEGIGHDQMRQTGL